MATLRSGYLSRKLTSLFRLPMAPGFKSALELVKSTSPSVNTAPGKCAGSPCPPGTAPACRARDEIGDLRNRHQGHRCAHAVERGGKAVSAPGANSTSSSCNTRPLASCKSHSTRSAGGSGVPSLKNGGAGQSIRPCRMLLCSGSVALPQTIHPPAQHREPGPIVDQFAAVSVIVGGEIVSPLPWLWKTLSARAARCASMLQHTAPHRMRSSG